MTLRIAMIGQIPLDSKADGIAAYLRAFVKYGEGIEVVYWGGESAVQHSFGGHAVTCEPIRPSRVAQGMLPRRLAVMLALWLKRRTVCHRADALFVHSSEWAIPFCFSSRRRPIVLVSHGWNPIEIAKTRGWLRYLSLRVSELVAVWIATRIVVVSREGYAGLCRRYPTISGKIVYVPTFIDDDIVSAPPRDRARERLGCQSDVLFLLCVARLVPEKQVSKAIDLVAALRRRGAQAELWLVGSGPEEARLRRQCAGLSVEHAVHFQGALSHDQMNLYYAAADFFLLLSSWEGTSIALLEALNLGVPAVVTDIADHRALIVDGLNGKVVQQTTAVEEAAEWILSARHSTPMSPDAIAQSARKYLASNVVPQLVDLLRSVAAR